MDDFFSLASAISLKAATEELLQQGRTLASTDIAGSNVQFIPAACLRSVRLFLNFGNLSEVLRLAT